MFISSQDLRDGSKLPIPSREIAPSRGPYTPTFFRLVYRVWRQLFFPFNDNHNARQKWLILVLLSPAVMLGLRAGPEHSPSRAKRRACAQPHGRPCALSSVGFAAGRPRIPRFSGRSHPIAREVQLQR